MYRLGFTPWDQTPGPQILDRVLGDDSEGGGRRALDVGCGNGRDAIYLAKKGWDLTALDLQERAIGSARERAAAEGVDVRWMVGDATDLELLASPPGYSLVYDLGCLHGLSDEAAKVVADGISSLADEDATLLVVAAARGRRMIGPRGMDREHVEVLFTPAWRLVGSHDMLGLATGKVPSPVRRSRPMAYHLVRV